ncbi:DUF4350 domain-containing protein [Nonlabens xiamenensis]|uniref:DUF4350 domain-containing protein n=1 Tax=Nonlabens xiamenensis TaxID=2341043 RepID=UPI000F614C54|nr:DUF4350 domain-containing protein [Nonlabens xiamenensis]
MNKKSKILLYVIFGFAGLLMMIELIAPPPINWTESYTSGDKIPFGAYVFYDQLDELFPGHEVKSVEDDPVTFLKSQESTTGANYVFVNNYIGFDQSEIDDVVDFVSRGNKVFVSSKSTPGRLADSLNIRSNRSYAYYEQDTVRVRLNNPSFENRSYIYVKGSSYRYFTSYDTTRTKVLGEVLPFEPMEGYFKKLIGEEKVGDSTKSILEKAIEKSKTRRVPQANFIEVPIGDGAIYYHLNPIAFTNYYMLQEGKEQYVSEVLSYLNDGPVYFDDYGKSGRRVVSSPLRFILTHPALKWAWYLTIISILVYFIFKAKREQRAVPVVKPLENSTLEFTKTIGDLYFQSGDVTGIIDKKINFFLERVRRSYYLTTDRLDEAFIKKLAIKSHNSVAQTRDMVEYIVHLRGKPLHIDYELKQLNKRIDAFFNK